MARRPSKKTSPTTETDPITGKITITVTVEKTTNDTTNDGAKVDGEECRTDTSVTDETGNTLQESWHENGYEKREWEEKLPVDSELHEVEAELNPGETATESVSKPTETIVSGDVPSHESDKSYDYEEHTTTVKRKANASVSNIESTEEQFGDIGIESIHPEEYDKTNINRPAGTAVVPKNAGNYHAHQVTDTNGDIIMTKYYPIANRKQSEYDALPDEVKANYIFDVESDLWNLSAEKNTLPKQTVFGGITFTMQTANSPNPAVP